MGAFRPSFFSYSEGATNPLIQSFSNLFSGIPLLQYKNSYMHLITIQNMCTYH